MRWLLVILILWPALSWAQPWPAKPPRIGRLVMPQEYWEYVLESADRHNVSPYIIQGFMAIESRYNPCATSGRGRCIGLMQLDKGVARGLGVNPWVPRENIDGGARVLAKLLKKYHGNLRLMARAYNGTGYKPYEAEVVKAVRQAKKGRE